MVIIFTIRRKPFTINQSIDNHDDKNNDNRIIWNRNLGSIFFLTKSYRCYTAYTPM